MRIQAFALGLLASFACSASFLSHGQNVANPIEEGLESLLLNEIPLVYQSTKRAETANHSALNITVITRDEIETYGLVTYKDLFMFIENGFETFKGRDRVYSVRGVMGYANDKIKFLINGLEFAHYLGLGQGEFPVTLDDVERIEIVKGPNTSLFGGNSTQATVNIIRRTGKDFQGLKTAVGIGDFSHARLMAHYAQKPTEDLDFDLYFLAMRQDGPDDLQHREFGADTDDTVFTHDVNNPLPDSELIASMNYKDLRVMLRRFEERRLTYNAVYTSNYALGGALEYTHHEVFGRESTDGILTLRIADKQQSIDPYHADPRRGVPIENRWEKDLEFDAHIHSFENEKLDFLAGVSGNFWQAGGGEFGQFQTTNTGFSPFFPTAPELVSRGITTAEFLPGFTEINDLADFELWTDINYAFNPQFKINAGGRYVYDFVPGNQLRDEGNFPAIFDTERELLRDFFPKVAGVYNPTDSLAVKLIYQEGFNRPSPFEQFSAWNTIPQRGRLKATTAKNTELVLDYSLDKNWRTKFAVFSTKMDDFMNFVYTGPVWPVVRAELGEKRGFANVGEVDVDGIEAKVEFKFEDFGGILSAGYLLKNKITPPAEFDPARVGSGATGIIYPAIDADYTKQSSPKWNANLGLYYNLTQNLRLSTIYNMHQDLQNDEDWTNDVFVRDINSWDVIFNANYEKVQYQFFVKNITNEKEFIGSAMDPAHREQQWPTYWEGKVTYLWS